MQITNLNHLANIKITYKNCDELIAESLELLKQASRLKLSKMQTESRIGHVNRISESKHELPVAVVRGQINE